MAVSVRTSPPAPTVAARRAATSCREVAHVGDSTSLGPRVEAAPAERGRPDRARATTGRRRALLAGDQRRAQHGRDVQGPAQRDRGRQAHAARAVTRAATSSRSAPTTRRTRAATSATLGAAHRRDDGASRRRPRALDDDEDAQGARPVQNANMEGWNAALSKACARHPNMRVYDWASEVRDDWFASDGIHFNTRGYRERAARIAKALARAFPKDGDAERRVRRPHVATARAPKARRHAMTRQTDEPRLAARVHRRSPARRRSCCAIDAPLDCDLEVAAVHRRVFAADGPALLFRNARGVALSARVEPVRRRRTCILHPSPRARCGARGCSRRACRRRTSRGIRSGRGAARRARACAAARRAFGAVARRRCARRPICRACVRGRATAGRSSRCRRSTPSTPTRRASSQSNLGMYRVQLSGNDYVAGSRGRAPLPDPSRHRRSPRGGVARGEALARERVRRRAAGDDARRVLPLPEGVPEIVFAGVLAGRATRFVRGAPAVHADADFVIRGVVESGVSSAKVRSAITSATTPRRIRSRCCAWSPSRTARTPIWPFTVVGRPPQEDTSSARSSTSCSAPPSRASCPACATCTRSTKPACTRSSRDRQRALRAVR